MQFSIQQIVTILLLAPTLALAAPAPLAAPGIGHSKPMTEFPEKRVFVSGLASNTGAYGLETALKASWGKSDVVKASIKYNGGTGKSTGAAIVEMKDIKAAKSAVSKGAPTVDGKKPSVKICTLEDCGN